ncbi:hypothetical protein FRC07_005057 [Ceratobasidium sp. 392]|nr:hypothetical protein FRC07_005057 [Ceratobasidium sp. 392]
MPEHHGTSVQLPDELQFTVVLVSRIAVLNPHDALRTSISNEEEDDTESGMAGLNAVHIAGADDVNVSELVGGHFDINGGMTKVLEAVKVNE